MKETSWARPSLLSGFTLPLEYAFKFCLQHLIACLVQSSKVFQIPQKKQHGQVFLRNSPTLWYQFFCCSENNTMTKSNLLGLIVSEGEFIRLGKTWW